MLEWLAANISLPTLLWLFPVTFMLHDFEEIIFVESWFKRNYNKVVHKVPKPMRTTFQEMSHITAARFSIPVLIQLVFYIIATYLAVEKEFYSMFVGFNLLLLLHVFTHLGQSLLLKIYALGSGTALFITLPYSLYLFYRLLHENVIGFGDLILSLPYGILTVLIVYFGHKLSPKLIS
ncbi:HXXEE domain-containing protein [Fictibacillus aquaticus]|uniref:HXXEE domain-containing protein n=1 Tax=Fictibacillus aquaticus TaxID=2021314 RepID=A0A235F6M7_9BACL|nr:HXXEE domain-containing protein [Fictibacillus aquaticus]OYD56597.1 hypothetical protein CGZ90_16425 [Fictibacillus aquaticus]